MSYHGKRRDHFSSTAQRPWNVRQSRVARRLFRKIIYSLFRFVVDANVNDRTINDEIMRPTCALMRFRCIENDDNGDRSGRYYLIMCIMCYSTIVMYLIRYW